MSTFKVALIGPEECKLLFTQFNINDKIHNFLVDCGSDLSYMYVEPMGITKTNRTREFYTHHGTLATAEQFSYQDDLYYLCDKPKVIEFLENNNGIKVSGVIGLDWLINNKIILNFGKLK